MKTHNKETQAQMTPRKALKFLQEGNSRFINNLKANRNLLEQANDTRDGQWPFATILSCIDSRTSAELIFDQGLGDVFSVRIAGNIVNNGNFTLGNAIGDDLRLNGNFTNNGVFNGNGRAIFFTKN